MSNVGIHATQVLSAGKHVTGAKFGGKMLRVHGKYVIGAKRGKTCNKWKRGGGKGGGGGEKCSRCAGEHVTSGQRQTRHDCFVAFVREVKYGNG